MTWAQSSLHGHGGSLSQGGGRSSRALCPWCPEPGHLPAGSGGGVAQNEEGEKELGRGSLGFWRPHPAEFPTLGVCWKNVAGSR